MSKDKRKRLQETERMEYTEIARILDRGNVGELEFVHQAVEDFPCGRDSFIGRHWVTSAIDSGSFQTIEWMIRKGATLKFQDDEGYSPVHSCIERERADKYQVLDLLLRSGADVNARGINDWTPLHMAAVHDDRKAIRMLLEAGADRTIGTRIDDYATPEEEARNLGHHKSADFLAAFGHDLTSATVKKG